MNDEPNEDAQDEGCPTCGKGGTCGCDDPALMDEDVTAIIDGVKVHFRRLGIQFLKQRRRLFGKKDPMLFCAVTGERMALETGCFLVMCNSKFFPNCVVSARYIQTMGLPATASFLRRSHSKFQEIRQALIRYPQWGGLETPQEAYTRGANDERRSWEAEKHERP